jgi:hypothetical protein
VHFVATNRTNGTLYLQACNPFIAEIQSANGEWLFITPNLTTCFSAPPTPSLPASGQLADSLGFVSPGHYRVTAMYAPDSGATSYTAYSNAFTVDSAP